MSNKRNLGIIPNNWLQKRGIDVSSVIQLHANNYKSFTRENREYNYSSGYGAFTDTFLSSKYNKIEPLFLSAVYAAAELISNSISLMPILVKQKKEGVRTILENHQISNIFNHLRQSKFIFIKQLIWDMLLFGNSYAYIVRDTNKKPIDLIYLNHGSVNVQYNQTTQELYYNITGYKDIPNKVEPQNIIHLYKNSKDGYNGLGILLYADKAIELAGYAEKSSAEFFSGGLDKKGILKVHNYIDEEQKADLRSNLVRVSNAPGGSWLILGEDADAEILSGNANDSQLIETRQFNIQEIARYFNISPVLLQDLTHSSYNTIEAANLEFVEHTLMPYVSLLECELNRKLIDRNNIFIDVDETVLLKGDKRTMATYITTLKDHGVITTNEARAMIDLNPVEGGDEIIIPYTNIADNTLSDNNEANNDEEQKDKEEQNNNTEVDKNINE